MFTFHWKVMLRVWATLFLLVISVAQPIYIILTIPTILTVWKKYIKKINKNSILSFNKKSFNNTSMDKYPLEYPRHGFHMCHGCGSMTPHHTQKDYPDNGWAFDMNNFGYYAGFTDPIGEDPQPVRLCHDCIIKFLDIFPLLSILVPRGSHSQDGPDEKPCCRYAWKLQSIGSSSITLLATENGESWEIM